MLATSALLATPQVHALAGVTGEWWTPGFNARVRIEPCGEAVCGRIVWLWDEAPKGVIDRNPLVGRLVIDRMQNRRSRLLARRSPLQPEDGRDYKGSLQLQSPERLVVDGCVLFICQTQVWRRADPGRCPPVAALSPQ